MSNKCIYQSEIPHPSGVLCNISHKELKKGCNRGYYTQFCDFKEAENKCPIVKLYQEYAETYHNDSCADCDHEDMEDSIRQCAEDAYS